MNGNITQEGIKLDLEWMHRAGLGGFQNFDAALFTPQIVEGSTLWIDLGDVKNIAVVSLNGKPLGTVWHAPYRVDATSALKAGANQVTVTVMNAWVNGPIGDLQTDATTKDTFSTWKAYQADTPLLPSGLLGPVAVVQEASH